MTDLEIHIVAAVASNGVIGSGGKIPWYIPADMEHFRELTIGKTVIMGHRTYDSIGQPLRGRRNIVLSRQPVDGNVEVYSSVDKLMSSIDGEIYVIGGAQIFSIFLPMAKYMHITHIHMDFDGDTFFPRIKWNQWLPVERQGPYHHGDISYEFVDYLRMDMD